MLNHYIPISPQGSVLPTKFRLNREQVPTIQRSVLTSSCLKVPRGQPYLVARADVERVGLRTNASELTAELFEEKLRQLAGNASAASARV